jgi:hypothetical protein
MKGTSTGALTFERWLPTLPSVDFEHIPLAPKAVSYKLLSGAMKAFDKAWRQRFGVQRSLIQMADQVLYGGGWYLYPLSQVEFVQETTVKKYSSYSHGLQQVLNANERRLALLRKYCKMSKPEWPLLIRLEYDRECTVKISDISLPVPSSTLVLAPGPNNSFELTDKDRDKEWFLVRVGQPGSVSFERAAKICRLDYSVWQQSRTVVIMEWLSAGNLGQHNAISIADDFISNRPGRLATQSTARKLLRLAQGKGLTCGELALE